MSVRKKPNCSGSISVVVVEKKAGKVYCLKTPGISSDVEEIEERYLQGKKWIAEQQGRGDMFLEHAHNRAEKGGYKRLIGTVNYLKSYFDEEIELPERGTVKR